MKANTQKFSQKYFCVGVTYKVRSSALEEMKTLNTAIPIFIMTASDESNETKEKSAIREMVLEALKEEHGANTSMDQSELFYRNDQNFLLEIEIVALNIVKTKPPRYQESLSSSMVR